MISLEIKINNQTLYVVQARRLSKLTDKNKVYNYEVEGAGGQKVKHRYSDGAIMLAIKMLLVLQSL